MKIEFNDSKKLLERQEQQITKWENILSNVKTTKKAKEILSIVHDTIEGNTSDVSKQERSMQVNTPDPKNKEIPKNQSIKKMTTEENFAAEIIADMPDRLYTESKNLTQKSTGHPAQKRNTPQAPQVNYAKRTQVIPESTVTKFFGKLGGSVSKSFLETPLSHHQQSTLNDSQTKNSVVPNFGKMAHHKLPKPISKEPQEEKQKKLLNEEEVIHLIQDLSDQKKKPMALQVLIKGGFTISDISDMSKISYSDLETTRSIYGD